MTPEQPELFKRRGRPPANLLPGPSELQIQIALVDRLRLLCRPGVLYWHTPNGGLRDKRVAAKLKAMGTLPGVADLLFLADGKFYSLELKARGWRSSTPQIAWRQSVNERGGLAAEAHGLDEAIAVLESWGLLKRAKSGTNG